MESLEDCTSSRSLHDFRDARTALNLQAYVPVRHTVLRVNFP